jgi:hypothetical protein
MVVISSIGTLTVMTEDALAVPDKFGTDQLYSTAEEEDDDDASALFLNNEDTEDDKNFLKTSHVCVLLYCQIFSRPILHKPFWLLITIKR